MASNSLLPMLSLVGFFFGLTIWSPLARGIGGSALLREPQPKSDEEGARRLKVVYFRMAIPWFLVFGGLALWLSFTTRGWGWVFAGTAAVPLVTGILFARVMKKRVT